MFLKPNVLLHHASCHSRLLYKPLHKLSLSPSSKFSTMPEHGQILSLANKRYHVVSNVSSIDNPGFGKDLCTLIVKDGESPSKNYQSLRLVRNGSTAYNQFSSHQSLIKRAVISAPNASILAPVESFEANLEGTATHCLVYDDLVGPNLYFLLNDDGPESYQFPAEMIRKIARQSLLGLALIHEQNIACRIHWSSPTLTYPSEKYPTDQDIIQLYGQDQKFSALNETGTGPENSEFDPDSFNIKLDLLDNTAYKGDLERGCSGLPPEISFDKSISPSADIWDLGSMLANLAAQTPEYDNIILGNGGDALRQILLSRTLLGELPQEYLSKIPDAKQQTDDFKEDALFLRIRDNPLACMAIDEYKFSNEELLQFVRLLKAMLVYSPAKRITARGALSHEFFRGSKSSDSD